MIGFPEQIDVCVIGGGHAGLCAAITAREAGREVVLLEKAPITMRGGNTRHTRNLRAMHEQPLLSLIGEYSAQEYWHDIQRVTAGNTNTPLTQMVIRQSPDLALWLNQRGVLFQPSLRGTLNLERTNAFFLGGGCALVNVLYRYAERIGVDIHYECEVVEIELNETLVQRIRLSAEGMLGADESQGAGWVNVEAVIVASGGFQSNEEWMVEAWGERARNFLIRGTPHNTGTMLKSLMRQNCQVVGDPTQCHAVAIDARAPKYDGGIVTRLDCVCYSVVVNDQGERFYDEGEDFWPKRYAIWGRLIADQTNQIAYAIIDSRVLQQFMPSVYPPLQAETLEELAKLIEVDAPSLQATVRHFNMAVANGSNGENYDATVLDGCTTQGLEVEKTNWALPISQPPFYAYPLRPGITFTYMGLKVDDRARVQTGDGRACDNLFAAGEIMAGNILGQGYCAGTGMTIGGVFGRIAGEEAGRC